MPKRKKLPRVPDYVGAGRGELVVQKSNPLQTLAQTDLTLSEFKILDVYLSRIDSHKPEARFVRFECGELEKLLGVERIPRAELEKRLHHLFQVVKVVDDHKPRGFKLVSLFEQSDVEPNEFGQWQVTLCCTQSALEYVFNVENIGYLRYRLRNIVGLTSRYSYLLYLYLERNRWRKSWEISVDELRLVLGCSGDSYSQFKVFNDRVLKLCYKELSAKTDCQYSYEPIKRGRRVASVRFSLSTQADTPVEVPECSQIELEPSEGCSILGFLSGACEGEFNASEMELVFQLICDAPLPPHSMGLEFSRYHYLAEKYAILKIESQKRKINNRFKYFCSIIKNDLSV